MSVSPREILDFWLNDVGPDGWYKADPEVDETCRKRFQNAWRAARAGAFDHWLLHADEALALIILLDQLPRNMFRDSAEAYSSDERALRLAKLAIARGHDRKIAEPARRLFYMPLMHSENLQDQDRATRLVACRMPETKALGLPHAKAHREVIRRFGRFPHRNEALGRKTSREEQEYLAAGGYSETVRQITAEAA